MPFEVLIRLVHKGTDSSLSPGLCAGIIRGIQIRDPEFIHERSYNCRGDGARHACKGINIYHTVISFTGIFHYSGDTQTGLCTHIKIEKVFFHQNLFKMTYPVVFFQINQGPDPFVYLLLPELLIIKIPPNQSGT